MTIHDAYGRLTPYELSLPGREFAEERFRKIEAEAEDRGVDLGDPGTFVLLQATGELLDEACTGGEEPELLHQYGALFFHGFHFWKAGEPFFVMEAPVVRHLVEGAPGPGGWTPSSPGPAGYVQLPRHLFWSQPQDEEPPEPLDGFFWTLGVGETVSILVPSGMRDDRPGFSVVTLPPLPLRDAGTWIREHARSEGDDFETTLPGGELDRLYSVVSTGEILKLVARTFWYADRFPDAVGGEERAEAKGAGPHPSALPFRKIRLRDGEASGGGGS